MVWPGGKAKNYKVGSLEAQALSAPSTVHQVGGLEKGEAVTFEKNVKKVNHPS